MVEETDEPDPALAGGEKLTPRERQLKRLWLSLFDRYVPTEHLDIAQNIANSINAVWQEYGQAMYEAGLRNGREQAQQASNVVAGWLDETPRVTH